MITHNTFKIIACSIVTIAMTSCSAHDWSQIAKGLGGGLSEYADNSDYYNSQDYSDENADYASSYSPQPNYSNPNYNTQESTSNSNSSMSGYTSNTNSYESTSNSTNSTSGGLTLTRTYHNKAGEFKTRAAAAAALDRYNRATEENTRRMNKALEDQRKEYQQPKQKPAPRNPYSGNPKAKSI